MANNNIDQENKSLSIKRAIGHIILLGLSSVANKLGPIIFLIIFLYFIDVTAIFIAFAGQDTTADINVGVETVISLSDVVDQIDTTLVITIVVLFVLCIIMLIWAFLERSLRKRSIKNIADEKSQLQKKLDSGRGSSNLTIKGGTNPEDKL